ncbi:hypothetical protein ACVCL3_15835 [Rhodanobacter sp. UC4437_H4]
MASNNRRELTIVLTGDAKGLTGTVKVIEAEMKKLGGSFDVVGDKARGAGKDAEDAAKRIEASNKRTAAAIGLVVAGAVAGFSALVKHQLDVADATGKMAQRLGVSTEFLSSMGYAAKSTGADSQVLASSLQSLAENQLKAAGGNKQYTAAFKAMGISFRDARGQLVPLADLLPAIAERFRTMPDGANKAALAAKLFGTEGTKLIPMLNQGAQGLADMAEQAAGLGLVLSQEAVDGATALKDQVDLLKSKMEGAANVFLREMLPSVLAMSGGMGDAAGKTNDLADAADIVARALKYVILAASIAKNIVEALAQTIAAMARGVSIAFRGVSEQLTLMGQTHDKVQSLILHGHIGEAIDTWKQGIAQMGAAGDATFQSLQTNGANWVDAIKSQIKDVKETWAKLFPSDDAKAKAFLDASTAAIWRDIDRAKELAAARKAATDWAGRGGDTAANAEAKRIAAVAKAYAGLADIQDRLQGQADPLAKAWADSAKAMRDIAARGAELIKNGTDESTVQAAVAKAVDDATAARNRAIEAARRQMDVSGRMIEQMQREAQLASMSPRDQAMARAGWEYEQQARQQNLDLTKDQIAAERQRVEEAAGASFDMQRYAEMQKQIAQEYVGFWENAAGSTAKLFADGLTGQVHDLKDFARSGKSILQQWVSDIISQFLRLRVLGPLLNGAMGAVAGWLGIGGTGGAGSWLQMASQYYGGGSTIGSAAGALGGGGGGGSGGSYGGMVSNISTARNAYNWAFGSGGTGAPFGGSIVGGSYITGPGLGTGAAGTAGSAGYAVNMPNGAVMYTGNGTMVSPATPYGGYIGNTGVSYAGVAGGLAGAYWGSQRGSGGVSTAASTVTGAVGGYYAGAAVATAMSSGVAAGLAAIPVVGWIALAAMLVDQISGGKLFGTKYKTAAINSSMSIGEGGADASLSLYQTKQRALFGGRKTRAVDQAVPPELQQAADSLYEGVRQTMVHGAQKLAIDVPTMINASLKTHVALNDKGQVRSTDYVVEYLGRTWKEATAEAASKRIGAEALVATVAASAGAVAQQIAEQWRSSADTLLDGATAMLAAQADINKGNSLVALGAGATLAQVIKFTQGLQAQGEALADTYARLAQASAQYTQFVKQFEPTSAGFGSSLQAIANQMQANIDQANALAQAAGLQHAREGDLANIHRVAAEQAAAAIAQLSAAAQDLVGKLYGVTGDTLASVNAQIDKLQGKLQTATQLAIGDNSPLSEKEKLDVALKGLRSGITSADDVLSLGRKLYASSADYAGLYAKVQDILQLPGAGQAGAAGIGSALDEYNGLIGKRDQLQSQAAAMARFNDAKTLAQYVADISTTHGIGYGEAASGLGFSLQDLAKDLGVTNLVGYLDNLKLADIPGTTMDASASIVTAIQQLGRDLIQTLTGGPITSASVTAPTTVGSNDPQVLALLAQINARLASIDSSSGDTAATNKQMVKQGANADLRDITRSNRNLSSNA